MARSCARHARPAITATRRASRDARRVAPASTSHHWPRRRRRAARRVWPAITVPVMRLRGLYRATSMSTARPVPSNSCRVRYSILRHNFQRLLSIVFFFFALFLAHNKKIIYACSKQNPQTPISTALFSERGVLRGRWRRRCARRRSAAGAGRARRASTRQHRTSLAAAEQGRRRPYIPGIMMISMMKQKQKTKTNSITGATTMKIMLSRAM